MDMPAILSVAQNSQANQYDLIFRRDRYAPGKKLQFYPSNLTYSTPVIGRKGMG